MMSGYWFVLLLRYQPGGCVKDVSSGIGVPEIKHRVQPAGKGIEGTGDTLTIQPVVLDKAQNRTLVSHRVIDVVLPRVG